MEVNAASDVASASSEIVQRIRSSVLETIERQLASLEEAREQHSHSDLLLPPDVVDAILSPFTLQLKSFISETVASQADGKDAVQDVVQRDLLGYELRRLSLSALHDGQSADEQRTLAKSLFDRLDIVSNFELHEIIDTTLPLTIHEEIMERLTIEECSLQFDYIESRVSLLTRGLVPSKGKGLILLRICNDLIRRLSKPTREHTVFAGRVLSLLSSVLPFGERSGVNFRGEFNVDNKTLFEDANDSDADELSDVLDIRQDLLSAKQKEETPPEKSKRTSKAKASKEERKAAEAKARRESDERLIRSSADVHFYGMFWTAQKWFANPALLYGGAQSGEEDEEQVTLHPDAVDPVAEGSTDKTVRYFRSSTRYILDVFGAVGRLEKELAGGGGKSNGDGNTQRGKNGIAENEKEGVEQHDRPEAGQDVRVTSEGARKRRKPNDGGEDDDAYFPKYLTGRNLFEYELRDATFRRHILAQYLILFQFLLSFTPKERERIEDWKNKALVNTLRSTTFTLEEADERWIRETWREIVSMLHEIPPAGRAYTDTVLLILQREINWLRWKSNDCPSIDRTPLSTEQLDAYARSRKALLHPLRPYPHALGTAALSRLWEDGVRKPEPRMRTVENAEGIEVQVQTDGLDDLEMGPMIPSLETYAQQVERVEERAQKQRDELGLAAPKPYLVGSSGTTADMRKEERDRVAREEKDATLAQLEQQRSVTAWRAMRLARAKVLDCFGKMRCDLPDGATSIGVRIDDVTRLMRAVSDKENGIPALPTPAPQSTAATVEQPMEGENGEDGEKASLTDDEKPKETDDDEVKMEDAKDEDQGESKQENPETEPGSPEYEPQETSMQISPESEHVAQTDEQMEVDRAKSDGATTKEGS